MSDDRRHDLKVPVGFWNALESGQKTFEVRYAGDRDFRVGDILHLREWDATAQTPEGEKWTAGVGYTGREIYRRISYVLAGEQWGLRSDYVALAIIPVAATPPRDAGERARDTLHDVMIGGTRLCGHGHMAVMCRICPVEKERDEARAALQSERTAASQARREAIEECAKVIVREAAYYPVTELPLKVLDRLYKAIRALATPQESAS
jgi:hypothetical protein